MLRSDNDFKDRGGESLDELDTTLIWLDFPLSARGEWSAEWEKRAPRQLDLA